MATDTTSCDWAEVLVDLDADAYVGEKPNATTARGFTRNQECIEATFWPAHPPLRSRLSVRCLDRDSIAFSESENPCILRMVDGLLLLRVTMAICRQAGRHRFFLNERDHFIYRADPPLLRRLPDARQFCFVDDAAGLLPHGDHFTVAALVAEDKVFTLHLLDSEIWSWRSIKLPSSINTLRFAYQRASTVLTLGGEGGTMAWVDLSRGILLCDVLSPNPALRVVPLPPPPPLMAAQLNRNHGNGGESGCPKPSRGVAFIKSRRCLSFVYLDVRAVRLPDLDEETGHISFRVDGWAINAWSNYKMTNSLDDWLMDCPRVKARSIKINRKMLTQLQHSQLLRRKQDDGEAAAAPERTLRNLCVTHPTPGMTMDSKNVVYLMARPKFLHPKAWILAVDMEKRTLQGVTELGTVRGLGAGVICCPASVSKHTMTLATSQVTGVNLGMLGNEPHQDGALE